MNGLEWVWSCLIGPADFRLFSAWYQCNKRQTQHIYIHLFGIPEENSYLCSESKRFGHMKYPTNDEGDKLLLGVTGFPLPLH